MPGSSFTKIRAWKSARRLVPVVYVFAARFPASELYALGAQMRRAAHSIHLNIAEGSGRLSNGEWQHFLGQARGSCMELESASFSAFDLQYCTLEEGAELAKKIRSVAKQINGLLRSSAKGPSEKKFKPVKAANR